MNKVFNELGDGELIGELRFKPKDSCELNALLGLCSIGFDPYTDDGQKRMLRCFKRYFCKPTRKK